MGRGMHKYAECKNLQLSSHYAPPVGPALDRALLEDTEGTQVLLSAVRETTHLILRALRMT